MAEYFTAAGDGAGLDEEGQAIYRVAADLLTYINAALPLFERQGLRAGTIVTCGLSTAFGNFAMKVAADNRPDVVRIIRDLADGIEQGKFAVHLHQEGHA